MSPRRLPLAAALAALALLAGAAHGSTPSSPADNCTGAEVVASGPVQLCGTTTLRGVGGERFVLDLPQQATVDLTQTSPDGIQPSKFADIRWVTKSPLSTLTLFTADTRIPAGGLCEDTRSNSPREKCTGGNLHLTHWGPGFEGNINVDNGAAGGSLRTSDSFSAPVTLPAGRYIAYLVADGTPTSVRLRLTNGGSGTATYTSNDKVALEYGFLPNMGYPDEQNQARSYGSTERITSGARQVFTAAAQYKDGGYSETEICDYDSAAPEPAEQGEYAYVRGCPLGYTTPTTTFRAVFARAERVEAVFHRGTGTAALGFNQVIAGVVEKTFGFRYSLDISEFAGPAGPTTPATTPSVRQGTGRLRLMPLHYDR